MGRKVPDVIYVPVGDGCIIAGVAKGFSDLRAAGLIDKVPRLVACQSERSDAIRRAIDDGDYRAISATTRADSISVDLPANGRMAAAYVRESGGWAVAVSDESILDAQITLTRYAGILAEPAAAAAYAALEKDRENLRERLGDDAEVMVLITGTGFKDMKAFDGRVTLPPAIENSVSELDRLRF